MFWLKACAATAEVEAKHAASKDVAKLKSALSFKVNSIIYLLIDKHTGHPYETFLILRIKR